MRPKSKQPESNHLFKYIASPILVLQLHKDVENIANLPIAYHILALVPNSYIIRRASRDILRQINSEKIPSSAGTEYPLISGFARVAFHDCIGDGGCDGCLDMSRPPNGGLTRYITILDGLFTRRYAKKMSRADFYALAAVAGLEKATSCSQDKFLGRYQLKFGRQDCSTVPHEDSQNSFPNVVGNIDDTLSYFAKEFSFNTRETVALLGAHTLGRVSMETSGFEERWVRNTLANDVNPASVLDNEYYKELLRPWVQVNITSPFNGRTRAQWQDPNTPANTVSTRLNPDQLPMLLIVDFCFALYFTVIDAVGHIGCRICSWSNILPGCCSLSPTLPLVVQYANNNNLWLSDFTNVFMKMISGNTNSLRSRYY